jgi:hypothetical protein
MTNQEYQELSRQVADKFGVPASITPFRAHHLFQELPKWLYQDLERVMRLAIEHELDIQFYSDSVKCRKFYRLANMPKYTEFYKEHHSREQAVIVAVMKALMEVEK